MVETLNDITDGDIRRTLSDRAFEAGLRYFKTRRVLGVTPRSDGTILGAVEGSEPHPYKQTIRLSRSGRGVLSIDGDCTCYVEHNCKHVAAVLIALRDQARRQADTLPLVHPRASLETPLPSDITAWLRSLEAAREVDSETTRLPSANGCATCWTAMRSTPPPSPCNPSSCGAMAP